MSAWRAVPRNQAQGSSQTGCEGGKALQAYSTELVLSEGVAPGYEDIAFQANVGCEGWDVVPQIAQMTRIRSASGRWGEQQFSAISQQFSAINRGP